MKLFFVFSRCVSLCLMYILPQAISLLFYTRMFAMLFRVFICKFTLLYYIFHFPHWFSSYNELRNFLHLHIENVRKDRIIFCMLDLCNYVVYVTLFISLCYYVWILHIERGYLNCGYNYTLPLKMSSKPNIVHVPPECIFIYNFALNL